MTRTLLALALLLTACGDDGAQPSDAAAPRNDSALPTDGGPPPTPWDEYACDETPVCVDYTGSVRMCPAMHAIAAMDPAEAVAMLATCRRWLRCDGDIPYPANTGGDCFVCRDWTSHPLRIEEPESNPSQPECTESLCPVPDGGTVRVCGDAGR
jgi:hypothetical protein